MAAEEEQERIRDRIYVVCGVKVMLDFDLVEIYGYETKNFNRQVKNNAARFEGDEFMLQLTRQKTEEVSRCNNFTTIQTKGIKGGRAYQSCSIGQLFLLASFAAAGEMGQRDPVRAIQTHHEMASPWFQKSLGEGRMKRQKGI